MDPHLIATIMFTSGAAFGALAIVILCVAMSP